MATRALFVYGTLKRRLRNHDLLVNQEFLGEFRTAPYYRLYDCGPYPCMVEDRGRGLAVLGEIWHVDEACLGRLDEFEGVPHLFVRREIDVAGIVTPVFAYLYQGEVTGRSDCGDCWPQAH